jgi:hypothetical protein
MRQESRSFTRRSHASRVRVYPGIEAKHEGNLALLSSGPRTDESFGLLGVLVTNAAVAEAGIVGPVRCTSLKSATISVPRSTPLARSCACRFISNTERAIWRVCVYLRNLHAVCSIHMVRTSQWYERRAQARCRFVGRARSDQVCHRRVSKRIANPAEPGAMV